VPAPSQVLAVFMAVAPEHVDGPQGLSDGYIEQVPKPSQVPVVPQLDGVWRGHMGWLSPSERGVQVPGWPTKLHERHAPEQAVLQQTPSAQCPDAHSRLCSQVAPFIFGPQRPLTHLRPTTQSMSEVHFAKHKLLLRSQENGAQTVAAPSLQPRAPSQTKLSTRASPSHVPALQTVPAS
jgi:hypothetical protein